MALSSLLSLEIIVDLSGVTSTVSKFKPLCSLVLNY